MVSIEIIYEEVTNLLFGLPFRLYLNILKTKKILQFSDKKFSTCVARHCQRKRLKMRREKREQDECALPLVSKRKAKKGGGGRCRNFH